MISKLRYRSIGLAGLLALALASPACGPSTSSTSEAEPQAAEDEQLAQREREIDEREAALNAREEDATAARGERIPASRPVEVDPSPSRSTTGTANATPRPRAIEAPPPLELPAGTQLDLEMLSDLSSGTSVVGDRFRARVVADVMAGGEVAIPAGSAVEGSVTEVVPLKKIGGQPQIALGFDLVELESGTVPIRASLIEAGKKQAGRDAAKIGGAAAAGAVLGHQVDSEKGKVIGAIVGGAIGTAVATKTGKEVELPSGTQITVQLEQAIEVPAGS